MLPPNDIRRRGHVSSAWADAPCRALERAEEVLERISTRLEPTELAPAEARRALVPICDRLAPRTADDVMVMASELVTNSALYAGGRAPIRVDAFLLPEEVVVAVTDEGPGFEPRSLRGSRLGEPGGHGLELVTLLAAAHGIGSRVPFCVWFAVWRVDAGAEHDR